MKQKSHTDPDAIYSTTFAIAMDYSCFHLLVCQLFESLNSEEKMLFMMRFHIGNFRFSSWMSEDLHSLTVLHLFWSRGRVDALLSVKSGDYNPQSFDSFAEHV